MLEEEGISGGLWIGDWARDFEGDLANDFKVECCIQSRNFLFVHLTIF
jgi:hypothetical protein